MTNIVIVGGGAAGIELATLLGRQFRRDDQHQVLLVEPEKRHYWKPRFHEVAAGSFDAELDTICYFTHGAKHGYQHHQSRLVDIDRLAREIVVVSEHGLQERISYDYLVIAVGAVSNDFATQGVQEHCTFLDTPEQARRNGEQLNWLMRSGGDRTVNIVGAGATGVELAAELAKLNQQVSRFSNAARLTINLIEASARILPAGPEKMSAKAAKRLQAAGVNIYVDSAVSAVCESGMTLRDERFLPADLQFWAAGVKAPEWLKNIGELESNRLNQLLVTQSLQTTLDERVFALGDCAAIPQQDGSMVPAKAQAANRAALHLAKELPKLIKGKSMTPFVYNDAGMFIALGHHHAVSSTLDGRLVLQGRLMRRMYDTIFRLHQNTVSGMANVSRLILAKRLKCMFKTHNTL